MVTGCWFSFIPLTTVCALFFDCLCVCEWFEFLCSIGGGDDTERLEKKGELKKLLEDCGAIGDEKADTKE